MNFIKWLFTKNREAWITSLVIIGYTALGIYLVTHFGLIGMLVLIPLFLLILWVVASHIWVSYLISKIRI